MKLTLKELIEKSQSLQPQDFTFSWQMQREFKKPHFWSFNKQIVYTVILKCNEIDYTAKESISNIDPKLLESYKQLIKENKAPYLIAARNAGFSRDMLAPTFTSTSLEKIQEFLDKQIIKASVYTILDSAAWKE